jgi:flagellar biosynthesis/type III secretory pathway protein FliH
MIRNAFLESFDSLTLEDDPPSAGPGEDWLAGHAAGLAEGRLAARSEATRLNAELVQTLADLVFDRAALEALLLEQIGPLFQLLIDRFLPDMATASLASRIVAELRGAAASDLASTLIVAVHPTQVGAVAAAVGTVRGLDLEVIGDPGLGPAAAMLRSPAGETALDMERIATAAAEALSALFTEPAETQNHG